jgi:transposase-like protein
MLGRKRNHELSLEEKLAVLRRRQEGSNYQKLSHEFGVDKATISRICSSAAALLARAKSSEPLDGCRTANETVKRLDALVIDYFQKMNDQGVEVTGPMLQDFAKAVAPRIYQDKLFFASHGWLRGFKRRHQAMLSRSCSNSPSPVRMKTRASSLQSASLQNDGLRRACLESKEEFGEMMDSDFGVNITSDMTWKLFQLYEVGIQFAT